MFYAQLNEEDRVIAVSQLSAPVVDHRLIRIEALDESLIGMRREAGRWVAPPPAPAPVYDPLQLIAARRYDVETAGITIEGLQIDTSRDSQSLITGAALAAMLDPAYVCRWKTPSGFVELSAEQILGVAQAVRTHVQACFDREATLLAELAAGTFSETLMKEGWPA